MVNPRNCKWIIAVGAFGLICACQNAVAQQSIQPTGQEAVPLQPVALNHSLPPTDQVQLSASESSSKANYVPLDSPEHAGRQGQSWMQLGDGGKKPKLELGKTLNKLVFSTIFILALCAGALLLVKRLGWQKIFSRTTEPGRDESEGSHVLQTIKIGDKNRLHVVQIAGARLVVGVDATGIKTITQLSSTFSHQMEQAASQIESILHEKKSETKSTSPVDRADFRRELILDLLSAENKL